MLKLSCFFSNVVKPAAKTLVAGCLLVMGPAFAAEPSEIPHPTPSQESALPEFEIHESGAASPDHQVRVGDRVTLQIELKDQLAEPGPTLTLKPAKIEEKPEDQGWFVDPSTLNQNGILRFIVSPLKGGSLTLPPLLISNPEDKVLAKTKPFTLTVIAPTQTDSGKPDLLDVISIGLPLRYWILLIVVLLLLTAGGIYAYRRYQKLKNAEKPEVRPIIQSEPDHLIALRKLDILFDAHPFSSENLKVVSFGVSEILKEFFSRRFHIDAQESTTDEMIVLLRKEALSSDQLREIQVLFNELDLYKFTKVESYPKVYAETQDTLKIKAQVLIQKWALVIAETQAGASP